MSKLKNNTLGKDLYASVVVFLVAIPLCLGIALASGAPLFSGLIAGIVGGIIVGSISNSSVGVSGPAAGLAVIVFNAIESLGGFEIFLGAVFVGGIIQVIMGLVKAGIIGHFFPSSVIRGMLAGIGIIIIIKEIPYAFGYEGAPLMEVFGQSGQGFSSSLSTVMSNISPGAITVCLVALAIIPLWDKVLSKKIKALGVLPGALVAVIVGIVYSLTFGSSGSFGISGENMVSVPEAESLSEFASFFTILDFSFLLNYNVWMIGLVIAIIASLETLLSVEATDKLDPRKRVTRKNRELLAQGTGNMISGLIGGLPITQVIVRSSANAQSGVKTKKSAIFHGFLLLFCVLLIPGILNMIPLAVLASVLFIVGYNLAKPALFKQMYKAGWGQFIPFMVTILGVVFTDLLMGIMMGMAVAIFIILRNSYKNSHFLHMEDGGNGRKKIKMKLAEQITFLNKGAVKKALSQISDGTEVHLDMSNVYKIDADVKEIIDDFVSTTEDRNIDLKLIYGDEENEEVKEGEEARNGKVKLPVA